MLITGKSLQSQDHSAGRATVTTRAECNQRTVDLGYRSVVSGDTYTGQDRRQGYTGAANTLAGHTAAGAQHYTRTHRQQTHQCNTCRVQLGLVERGTNTHNTSRAQQRRNTLQDTPEHTVSKRIMQHMPHTDWFSRANNQHTDNTNRIQKTYKRQHSHTTNTSHPRRYEATDTPTSHHTH